MHAKSRLTPETTSDTPVRSQGPGRACPDRRQAIPFNVTVCGDGPQPNTWITWCLRVPPKCSRTSLMSQQPLTAATSQTEVRPVFEFTTTAGQRGSCACVGPVQRTAVLLMALGANVQSPGRLRGVVTRVDAMLAQDDPQSVQLGIHPVQFAG